MIWSWKKNQSNKFWIDCSAVHRSGNIKRLEMCDKWHSLEMIFIVYKFRWFNSKNICSSFKPYWNVELESMSCNDFVHKLNEPKFKSDTESMCDITVYRCRDSEIATNMLCITSKRIKFSIKTGSLRQPVQRLQFYWNDYDPNSIFKLITLLYIFFFFLTNWFSTCFFSCRLDFTRKTNIKTKFMVFCDNGAFHFSSKSRKAQKKSVSK